MIFPSIFSNIDGRMFLLKTSPQSMLSLHFISQKACTQLRKESRTYCAIMNLVS